MPRLLTAAAALLCCAATASCAKPTLTEKATAVNTDTNPSLLDTYSVRCSSCLAVAWELGALLSTEKAAPDVTSKSRKGNPKKVSYLTSEVRTTELLERLCPLMSGYGLYSREHDGVVLYHRKSQFPDAEAVGGATQRLRLFCDRFVGDHEEQLEQIIRLGQGIGAGDMEALAVSLCTRTSPECKSEGDVLERIPFTAEYRNLWADHKLQQRRAEREHSQRLEKEKLRETQELRGDEDDDDDGEFE